MTIIYRRAALTGSPSSLLDALWQWDGFTNGQTRKEYKRGVRVRAYRLYEKWLPMSDLGIIRSLAELGELSIIAE